MKAMWIAAQAGKRFNIHSHILSVYCARLNKVERAVFDVDQLLQFTDSKDLVHATRRQSRVVVALSIVMATERHRYLRDVPGILWPLPVQQILQIIDKGRVLNLPTLRQPCRMQLTLQATSQ